MYTENVGKSLSFAFFRVITSLIVLPLLSPALAQTPVAEDGPKIAAAAHLSLDDVVDNLVRKNAERMRNLLHSEATRVYHLTYRGFPGNREAEMVVEACYDRPASKEFKIISQSGSKLIVDRVFAKLLEAEKESIQPQIASQTQLNRDNYQFELVGFDAAKGQYELQVTPKHKNKFVYRGSVWVDATDFAVTRIEAEPAQNPSFWTKKSEVHQEYRKVQNSWVPATNESVSYIRLGGRATLTIEYKDYRLTEAENVVAGTPDGIAASGDEHSSR